MEPADFISCQEFSPVLPSLTPVFPLFIVFFSFSMSLLSTFSCFACCGYKRGVDYKIMKIYGSPPRLHGEWNARGTQFVELSGSFAPGLWWKWRSNGDNYQEPCQPFRLLSLVFSLSFSPCCSGAWHHRYRCTCFIVVTG